MSTDNTLTTTKPVETPENLRIAQEASDATTKLNKQNPLVAKDSTSTQTTGDQARNISYEMSQGAGIGNSGKVESFTTADGKNISGQTFTTKDGTYMKVAGTEGDGTNGKGATYKIESGSNGERSLSSIDASGKKEPVELKQSSDKQPAVANDKPVANNDKSATSSDRSPTTSDRATSSNDTAPASTDKTPRNEKPPESSDRPAATTSERPTTVDHTVNSDKLASTNNDRQAQENVDRAPSARNEKTARDSEAQTPEPSSPERPRESNRTREATQPTEPTNKVSEDNSAERTRTRENPSATGNSENVDQVRSRTSGDRDAAAAAANRSNGSNENSHEIHSDSSRNSSDSHVQNQPQQPDVVPPKSPVTSTGERQNFTPPPQQDVTSNKPTITDVHQTALSTPDTGAKPGKSDYRPPVSTATSDSSTPSTGLNNTLRQTPIEGRQNAPSPSSDASPVRPTAGEVHQATGQQPDLHQGNQNNDAQNGRQRQGTDGRQSTTPMNEVITPAKPPSIDGVKTATVGGDSKSFTPNPTHVDTPIVANTPAQILSGNPAGTGSKLEVAGTGVIGQTKDNNFQPATPASPSLQSGFSGDPTRRLANSGDQTQGGHDNNNQFRDTNRETNREINRENRENKSDSGTTRNPNGSNLDGTSASQGQPHGPEGQSIAPTGTQKGEIPQPTGIISGVPKSGTEGLGTGAPKGGVEGTPGLGTPGGLRTGSDGVTGTNLPKPSAPELPNLPGGINRTGTEGSPIISGVRPVVDGTTGINAPRPGSEGSTILNGPKVGADGNPILNAPRPGTEGNPVLSAPRPGADGGPISNVLKPGADGNSILNVPRPGADVGALPGLLKPGPDVLSKVAPLPDVLAPTIAQNLALRQAGFNINNPADAAFLATARTQLMAGRLGDGTTPNTTLAHALSGAPPAELNKLAVLLTGKPDVTAQNVMLNEANLARLNALFKPEAVGGLAGLPSTMDVRGLAGKGMGDFLAVHQGPLAQKDVYMELSKLLTMHSLTTTQRLTMVDLVSHGVNPLAATLTPGTMDAGHLAAKPENATALANALQEARTRAAELTELVGAKALVPVGARADLAEGLGALGISRGLVPNNQLNDGKTGLADPRLAARPNSLTTSEAMATTRATQDAVRANAGRIADIEAAEGGTDIHLTPRNDTVEISDKHADAKKKPDKKGDNQGLSIDASILTGAALRMFDGKSEDKKEDVNTTKKDDENKSQRRKYTVQPNDTLESIAQKTYRDTRLAALIAAVNSEVLSTDMNPRAPLTPGLSIWIPSEIEVEDFMASISVQAAEEKLSPEEELARRFGNGWDGAANSAGGANTEPVVKNTLMDAAIAATAKRRENVEKLLGPLTAKTPEFVTYTVRLGDSLKSIATKHPALQDVALWPLIAKVNEISVPANNASAVKLNRGSSLRLPTTAEISEYRASLATKKPSLTGVTGVAGATSATGVRTGPATGPKSLTIPAGNPFANADLPGAYQSDTRGSVDENAVTRASAPIRDAGASLLRAGGFVKDQSRAQQDAATIVTSPVERLPRPEISKPVTTDRPSVENIKVLSPDCRVVRRHQVDTSGRLYQAQLEVLHDGKWNSVMMYNISDGNCWRKSINEVGVTEILQLELPTPAIHQMLESDFTNNWEEYRDRFINTMEF